MRITIGETVGTFLTLFWLAIRYCVVAMIEERFLHGKHRGKWRYSIFVKYPRCEPLRTAMADHSTRLRKAEWENRALREGECQQNDVTSEWRCADGIGSLAERMKRLSFDGLVDEIKFRGCARRQESGTHGRWKWTALFGQRNKNIYLDRSPRRRHRRFLSMKNSTSII